MQRDDLSLQDDIGYAAHHQIESVYGDRQRAAASVELRTALALRQGLAAQAGVPELVHAPPGPYVHRDAAAIDVANALPWQLRRRHGAQIEVLEGAALRDAEPELSPLYTRGVRMGPWATPRIRTG